MMEERRLRGIISDMDSSPRGWVGHVHGYGMTKTDAVRAYAKELNCEPKVRAVRAAAIARLEELQA